MITELDVFNAHVTLALARHARFPTSPFLVPSEIGKLEPLTGLSFKAEEAADRWIFESKPSWVDIYKKFWAKFPYTPDIVGRRITLNAPKGALTSNPECPIVTDPRLGSRISTPEQWAAGLDQFNDVTLFSDESWTAGEQDQLLNLLLPGMTITLLRPSLKCSWFPQCCVKHDFTAWLERMEQRFEIDQVYCGDDPWLVTVLGLRAFK